MKIRRKNRGLFDSPLFFFPTDFLLKVLPEPTRVGYLHGFPPITYKFYKLSVGKKVKFKQELYYIYQRYQKLLTERKIKKCATNTVNCFYYQVLFVYTKIFLYHRFFFLLYMNCNTKIYIIKYLKYYKNIFTKIKHCDNL